MYGKNRHTHQSAKLQTIIYNAICNLFIDPILVCSGVRTFICIDCTFIMYESVPFNVSMLADVHRFYYTKMCNVQCMVRVIHVASNAFCMYQYLSLPLFCSRSVCFVIINSLHVLSCTHTHTNTQVNTQLTNCLSRE